MKMESRCRSKKIKVKKSKLKVTVQNLKSYKSIPRSGIPKFYTLRFTF